MENITDAGYCVFVTLKLKESRLQLMKVVCSSAGRALALSGLAWLEESITPLLLPWLTAESRHRAPDGDGKTRDGGGCGKVSTSHTSVLTVTVDQISAIFSGKPEIPPQPGSGAGTEAAALPGCHDLV